MGDARGLAPSSHRPPRLPLSLTEIEGLSGSQMDQMLESYQQRESLRKAQAEAQAQALMSPSRYEVYERGYEVYGEDYVYDEWRAYNGQSTISHAQDYYDEHCGHCQMSRQQWDGTYATRACVHQAPLTRVYF